MRDFDQKMTELKYPIFIELRKEEGAAFYNRLATRLDLRKKRSLARFFVTNRLETISR